MTLPVPAGKGARVGVPEQSGDAAQRVGRALDVAARQLTTHFVEQVGERQPARPEAALQGAHVQAQAARHLFGAGPTQG